MSYETVPVLPLIEAEEPEFLETVWEFDDGSRQSRAQYHRERRSWNLKWPAIKKADLEKLRSFVVRHKGAALPFYLELVDPVAPPWAVEEVKRKDGGALGNRNLYVGCTWSDGTYETTISETVRALYVADGKVLTVLVPDFPSGVDRAYVYVGTSASALKQQTPALFVSGGSWGEPTTGYSTGGAAPPTTNQLEDTPLVLAVDNLLDTSKGGAYHHSAALRVREDI